MNGLKLFFVVDTDWFFISHRLPVALAAQKLGYQVTIVAADTGSAGVIRSHGLRFIHADLIRRKLNIFQECSIVRRLYNIYRKEKPDIVHQITLKIIINGSIAAKLAGIEYVINAVAGLGHYFITPEKAWLVNLVFSPVFRIIRSVPRLHYIFQNADDQDVFVKRGWIDFQRSTVIKGSGIDLDAYCFSPEPDTRPVKVLCGTRMLRDKGIVEFVEAAAILKEKYKDKAEFVLAGKLIQENPTGIQEQEIKQWQADGLITYIGFQEDMFRCLTASHINVLPSYREGLPKSLIEASAVGRPIVTTDVPGCRDVVSHGINGLLIKAGDAAGLAASIAVLIEDANLRARMGVEARRKAEREFSIHEVINKTMAVYVQIRLK